MRYPKWLWVPSLAMAGCATTFSSSGHVYPPRPDNCSFEVFSVPPATGFEQVGTIDIPPGYAGANQPRTLGDLQKKIAPDVCHAGGDAIFASPNGAGAYITATVLKRISAPTESKSTEAVSEPGCQFDTQCKGDRVCMNHECVAPPK
jgi:hypothetical protein